MSATADEILEAAIRDAKTATMAVSNFGVEWNLFMAACQAQKFDTAHIYGERLVALVESAVDLLLTSNRRIAQFERLSQEPDSE